MNTKLLKIARRLWDSPFVSRELNRRNQLHWARAAHRLGDKWLLAKYVERRDGNA